MVLWKKILIIALSALVAIGAGIGIWLALDKEEETPPPEQKINYTFTVKTESGAPVPNAKIILEKSGADPVELTVDDNGTVQAELAAGYQAKVGNLPDWYYSSNVYTLIAGFTSYEFTVVTPSTPTNGDGGQYSRYEVGVGSYVVTIDKPNEEIFYAFRPTKTGTYRVYSKTLDDLDPVCKAYAGNLNLGDLVSVTKKDVDNISETDKNFSRTFEVNETYLFTPEGKINPFYCTTVGLKLNGGATGSFLVVFERVSDYVTVTQTTYETVQSSVAVTKQTAPAGKSISVVPYAWYDKVTLGDDGYYHVKDGAKDWLVYAKLTSYAERIYASTAENNTIKKAAENEPSLFKHQKDPVYNAEDLLVSQTIVDYAPMMQSYFENTDGNGMYPVTPELKTWLVWYTSATGGYLISLPETIPAKYHSEAKWLAPCYFYCDQADVQKDDTYVPPNGTTIAPYLVDGNINYGLTGNDGKSTGYANPAWWKYTATQTGTLKLMSLKKNIILLALAADNMNAPPLATITNEAKTVTFDVTEGDEIMIQIQITGTANTSGAPGENTEDEGDACSLLISYVDMTAGSVDNPTALTATGSYTAPLQQTNGIATSDYWYAFTPSETGTYFIGNKINSDATYGLYAQSHIYADRYANSMEFTDQDYNYLECDLTAGTTYYLKVCSFNNVTQNLSFTIEKITKVYDGTQLRPYLASVGEMQTTVAAGTEIAVEIYYVYTVTANGTVTIELPAAATDTAACLKIYKNDTSIDVINHGFYETETQDPDTSCALPVQTGDVITIVVSRITKDTSSDAAIYPDGTVTWTLAFSAAL